MDVERLDDLRELIGEYWCLAFAEGQEGRNTDTPDGAAQRCISTIEEIIREARAALTPPEGHVVVTRNEAGQAVAVTRQDDEGRILSVIAEFAPPEGYVLVPVAVQKDAQRYRWLRDSAPEEWDVTRWLDNDTQELHVQDYLDEAIDSAMLAASPEVKP